jgi:carbamoyl-phosphate synthase small subunit
MQGYLQLENGKVFKGRVFGATDQEVVGEVVFNTGMTGYQEILTDPSYYGQIVTMTYPLIGNYGINLEDIESVKPHVRGFIVRENCEDPSNFRCEMALEGYLKYNNIIAIEGIDTRALTKMLRTGGTMRGLITKRQHTPTELMEKLDTFDNTDAVSKVSRKNVEVIQGSGKHVAVMDYGVKNNIIRSFRKRNCHLTIFPWDTPAEQVLAMNPDGIFLSNGPGDPAVLKRVVSNVKKMISKKPVVGICLGHQLLALALGGQTEKLKFGHHGCNHPVKDFSKDRVYISSQNHNYVVSDIPEDVEVTHISLNDQSVEGIKHKTLPLFSVQFHPEAGPGPSDAHILFDEFLETIG